MKKWSSGCISLIFPGLLLCQHAHAQLTIGAQLRTRAELRDGQGNPQPLHAPAAFFISQRARISTSFKAPRLQLGLSIQDVRVWGQDASTMNRTTTADNNGLMIHEAWAAVALTDTAHTPSQLWLQVGRQELRYDDERLLGNLDWLQQARRHDALLLKFSRRSWTTHLGLAFNQNKENAAGTVYNPVPPGNYPGNTNGGSNYKSLQYLWVHKQFSSSGLSFLFLADQFSRSHTDSTVKVWENKTYNRITAGLYYAGQLSKWQYTFSAYYQDGHNAVGTRISAYLLSANINYLLRQNASIGIGADYTRPDFDPLYGTPHKFWGAMDYFYAASLFGNKGLQDYYIRGKVKASPKSNLSAAFHEFYSVADIPSYSKNFGLEADLAYNYTITPVVGLEVGYSHFWNTNTLTSPTVKNVPNASGNSNWAYVSLLVQPQFTIK